MIQLVIFSISFFVTSWKLFCALPNACFLLQSVIKAVRRVRFQNPYSFFSHIYDQVFRILKHIMQLIVPLQWYLWAEDISEGLHDVDQFGLV